MIKGPQLVRLDFKAGTAHRYQRQHNMVVAGLGWELVCTHKATFDPGVPLENAIESFRVKGC